MASHAGSRIARSLRPRRHRGEIAVRVIRRPATPACPAWRCTPNLTPSPCMSGWPTRHQLGGQTRRSPT